MPYPLKRFTLRLLLIGFLYHPLSAQIPVLQDLSSKKWRICEPFTTEPVTPFLFDEARQSYGIDTLVRVKKDGRFGLYASSGRVVVPPTFDDVFDDWATGIREGFVGVQQDGKRGLYSTHTGEQVLAINYEYVRSIYPDLLVARIKGSSTLTFFNGWGKKLFEAPGYTAWPGFDKNTIEVLDEARNRRFLDKQGLPVFSERFKDARWTDGVAMIVVQFTSTGSMEQSALLKANGDTTMGFRPFNLTPVGLGRFLARSTKNQQMALIDWRGNYLLSLREFWLVKQGMEDPNGVIYAQKQGFAEGHQLFDAAGKLLFDNCLLTNLPLERVRAYKQPAYNPQKYFQLELTGKPNSRGFLAADGRMIAPMAFQGFQYYSDWHPIIAFGNHPTKLDENIYQVFDLNTGKKLFVEDYQNMHFTAHPSRFWAKKGGRWGLIETGRNTMDRFEYDKIKPLYRDYMAAQKAGKWYVFDPDGMQLGNEGFDNIQQPTWEQFEQAHKRGFGAGKLIAVGTNRDKPDGAWYGISVSGKSVYFSNNPAEQSPAPVLEETIAPPPEIAEKEWPVAAETAETEPLDSRPSNSEWSTSNEVYTYADLDALPRFPGGPAIMQYLRDNLQYPAKAKKNGTQGRVKITFIVEKDGSRTDLHIDEDLGDGCGEEVIRLVKAMPKWVPGEIDGKVVRARHTLSIPFTLDK